MLPNLMIYGANGYSAKLILTGLISKGVNPIIAGRNEVEIRELANHYSLQYRIFDLNDDQKIIGNLSSVHTLLNCAGPYKYTAKELMDACIECGVNYIDITGEIPILALAFGYNNKAIEKGITILPGAGFDIIPTDCLAKRMKELMPDAMDLKIAFHNNRGKISRGTLLTTLEFLSGKGRVRRDGKIIESEIGEFKILIRKPEVSFDAISIPWGDVFTAYISTGIPNITVYLGVTKPIIFFLSIIKSIFKLLTVKWIKRVAQKFVEKFITGPTEKDRKNAYVYIWCKVENEKGESLEKVFKFIEGYTLTAKGAAGCAMRILNGEVKAGTYTPSMAFGSKFMDQFIIE